jgi:hypothetical protein
MSIYEDPIQSAWEKSIYEDPTHGQERKNAMRDKILEYIINNYDNHSIIFKEDREYYILKGLIHIELNSIFREDQRRQLRMRGAGMKGGSGETRSEPEVNMNKFLGQMRVEREGRERGTDATNIEEQETDAMNLEEPESEKHKGGILDLFEGNDDIYRLIEENLLMIYKKEQDIQISNILENQNRGHGLEELNKIIKKIISEKLNKKILYFFEASGNISKYFIKYLFSEYLDSIDSKDLFINQASIHQLYMLCLENELIKTTLYDCVREYVWAWVESPGSKGIQMNHIPYFNFHEQKARGEGRDMWYWSGLTTTREFRAAADERTLIPLVRAGAWWWKYRNYPRELTDENFLEGIEEKITELRIIGFLINKVMMEGIRASRRSPRWAPWVPSVLENVKQECTLVYELIDYYISHGGVLSNNPRIDWVGDNDFAKKCKALLSEFEFKWRQTTVHHASRDSTNLLVKIYSLKEIGDEEEKKYFTKINIGTELKRDLQEEEQEALDAHDIILREFTEALEYQQQKQQKQQKHQKQDPFAGVPSASSRGGGKLLKIKSKKRNKYKQTRHKRRREQTKHKRKPKKARDKNKNKLKKKKTQNKNR